MGLSAIIRPTIAVFCFFISLSNKKIEGEICIKFARLTWLDSNCT